MSASMRLALVVRLQLTTLASGLWKKRKRSSWGAIAEVFRVSKYAVLVLLAQATWGGRARIIVSLFAWARRIDDRVDDLSSVPLGIGVRSYLAAKKELLRYSERLCAVALPALVEDLLLIDAVLVARRLRLNLSSALNRLWVCFSFDVGRIHTFLVLSKEVLIRQAVEQDKAILVPAIEVMGGSNVRAEEVVSGLQGMFTRIDWLYDVLGDVQQGIVNIPEEAISEFHISIGHLRRCRSWSDVRRVHGFPQWYQREADSLARAWVAARQAIEALSEEQFTKAGFKFRQRVFRMTLRSILGLFEELLAACSNRFAAG